MEQDKKTSEEWYQLVRKKYPKFVIYDADGWDRTNYHYSFHEEKITQIEFWHRVMYSTCIGYIGIDHSI